VAVKVLRRDLSATLGAERFLKEIEIAAGLTHPHVLALHDSGTADGTFYYVMPFVDGESLRNLLLRQGTLPLERAVALTREVAGALSYAHRNGVVQRDIKPENILLAEGHAVVSDFGIAKAVSTAGTTHLTRTGFPVGTPGYMSPEQAAGNKDLDARTDVYSLACVFYEMVVGAPPGMWVSHEAERLRRLVDAPPEHRERLDLLPGSVEQALVAAMAMNPRDRVATPALFAEAIERAAGGDHRRYGDTEATALIRRASEIQASQPTNALSLGGVQQIAAEVGIPP
jgi:serine/threonine protein kinase